MTPDTHAPVYILFSDIEGSTRLWEQQPQAMQQALACHDALGRAAVLQHRGRLVKGTGDGLHAVFDDAADALRAALQLQQALADPAATAGLALLLRCGLHVGRAEHRDNDVFGAEVNRAARIMGAAFGGQLLLSQGMADALHDRLPDGVSLRALGAVRLKDINRPESVWQVLAPPLRTEFPPLRAMVATPHNLPAALNRFIGRSADLPQVQALLAGHRLVTLLGTGGIGKTRLATQLGSALLDQFADGVWLVELAPLAAGPQAGPAVVQAVAAVLGVKEAPGGTLDEALATFVRGRGLLLVLDNCEHLAGAAAGVAKRLMQAGAGLRVLATSREALRVAGEAIYPVPALSAPDPQALPDRRTLLQHGALELFIDRARAVQPGWLPSADDAAAVARICHRLDGIPLAIELAAARTRSLPLAVLAKRLLDSFGLVTTTDETVAPRQRTLQHLIGWSHDLLQPAEQRLFVRLSVFAGGFTLDAAEAVCADAVCAEAVPADAPLPAGEVLDGLAQLVDKSLLALDLDTGRYRLLETVRLYAAERLAADQAPALHRAHLAHFVALAEQAGAGLQQADAPGALQQLDAERANLLAAHGHGLALPGGAPLALRLNFALRGYWLRRGLLSQGLDTLSQALDHPDLRQPDARRARALFEAGHLCNSLGRYGAARDVLQDSVAIVRALGDTPRLAMLLQPLGMAWAGLGDLPQARQCLEAAVAAARQIERPHQLAAALVALAQAHRLQQAPEQAEPLYREALALTQAVGDAQATATVQLNLGMVALLQGRPHDALPALRLALQQAQASGDVPLGLGVLDLAFGLAAAQGHPARAWPLQQAALALCERTGLRRDVADEAFLAQARQGLSAAAPPTGLLVDMPDDLPAALQSVQAWAGPALNPRC